MYMNVAYIYARDFAYTDIQISAKMAEISMHFECHVSPRSYQTPS